MGAIVDQKTPHLSLPLPHSNNQLADDVERIRLSLAKVDTDSAAKDSRIAAARGIADSATLAAQQAQSAARGAQSTAATANSAAAAADDKAGTAQASAEMAQATADEALTLAGTAAAKPGALVVSPPQVTLPAKVALGYPAHLVIQDGPVKICPSRRYRVSVNSGTADEVTAAAGRGEYEFAVGGAVGDTLTVSVVTVDELGNRSEPAVASADVVDITLAAVEVLSPAPHEAYVSINPLIRVAPMDVIGGVPDVAKWLHIQVATDHAFTNIVFDSGAENPAPESLSYHITSVTLARGMDYYIRGKWTGQTFDAGSFSAPQHFTTLPAQVIAACQTTTGTTGRTWARVDVDGNAMVGSPDFVNHPVYAGITANTIDGQSMIGFPKCFVCRETLATGQYTGKDMRAVSDIALPGYEVHPAFLADGGNTAMDMVWVGRYQASADGSTKAASKAGVAPLVSIDFPTAQSRCTARNTGGVAGFHLWNIHELSLIQLLMVLELGGTDVQTLVGRGHVDNSPAGAQNVDHATVAQASWRGLVGLWGNIYQMCDGFRGGGTNYKIDSGKGFIDTVEVVPSGNIYPNKMLSAKGSGWSFSHLFIADPTDKGASNTDAAYPDTQTLSPNSSDNVLYVGGYWSYASSAGLFCANLYHPASHSDTGIGCRLAKF